MTTSNGTNGTDGDLAAEEKRRNDGWMGVLTGLGDAARDKRLSVGFARTSSLGRTQLESLYHGDDVVARICELIPRECLREWIEIQGDPDGKVTQKLASLDVRGALYEANVWARLYGGGAIILGALDGQAMDQPLNIDRVTAFDWLTVVDRWDVDVADRYKDTLSPKFDEPERYRIRKSSYEGGSSEALVHESRIIRFDGVLTGRQRKRGNNGWSDGVIDRVYDVVRDFNAAFAGAALLTADFSQAVFKIKNLATMLAADQDNLVLKRMEILDLSRSIARAVVLDADGEEFDRKSTGLAGLPEILDRIAQRLSAATGIPMTLLMGESPAGLNATGESDHRFFYNLVKNIQETTYRRPLAYLIRLAAKAIGVSPADSESGEFAFAFRPLWQPTESEIATTRKTVAETDQIYHSLGVLDAAEIGISRFGGEKYSIETTIDKGDPDEMALGESELGDPDVPLDVPVGTESAKSVQDTALNGAQIGALRDIIKDIAAGEYPKATGRAMVLASFPGIDQAEVDRMLAPIEEGSKRPTPVPPQFGQRAPANAPPENLDGNP